MKKPSIQNKLSQDYLETLTSSQLIELADENGIDIPDDLNRRFIIAELLEVAKEISESSNFKETINVSEDAANAIATELSDSYNETKIDVILRNPVSLFVYWDFSEVQYKTLVAQKTPLSLEICFFENNTDEKPCDTFEIQIDYMNREQFILIPGGKKFVRVDLIQNNSTSPENVLAVSSRLEIPQPSEDFKNFRPGMEPKIKPVLELSGIKTLFKDHYNNYRQSFY